MSKSPERTKLSVGCISQLFIGFLFTAGAFLLSKNPEIAIAITSTGLITEAGILFSQRFLRRR